MPVSSRTKAAAGGGLIAAIAIAAPLISAFEGERRDPYLDIVKVKTVCFGHTGPDIQNRHYSAADCQALLQSDLMKHAGPVVQCVPQIRDKPYQLAASISLAFNIGAKAFCGSSAAREFRAGRDAAACAAFDRWTYAGGKQVAGLVRRRAAERSLCERGL